MTSGGDVRIGDNTTVIQKRRVDGTQVEVQIGPGSRASNGVASIISGRGVRIGNGATVIQTGRLDGTQVEVATGLGDHASRGGASTLSGRVRVGDGVSITLGGPPNGAATAAPGAEAEPGGAAAPPGCVSIEVEIR